MSTNDPVHGSAQSPLAFYQRSLDCVHCGLCLPACPTYRVLGNEADSPRGRIYLMRALAEGRVEEPAAIAPYLDRCLGCRACETACPSGVRYGEILEAARCDLQARAPKRGPAAWLTRFLLWHVVAHQRRLRLLFTLLRVAERLGLRALAAKLRLLPAHVHALAPPVPPRRDRRPLATGLHPAFGERRGRVALFTGCIMEPMFGRVNRATLKLLRHNGFDVVVPEAQRCCGALLLHAGFADRARELARANLAAFADCDRVIHNSAGCGAALGDYGHLLGDEAAAKAFAAKCVDITAFLAEVSLRTTPAEHRHKVAYDDPCHLCHGQGVRDAPRKLLAQVPGLELVPHERPEDCCGSAGIYNLLQPELAREIGTRKAAALVASGAETVVTGNPGCMMQIQSHLRAGGHRQPVVHPVELLLPPE